MRYVVAIIGVTVSIGLILVSLLMNFRFGQLLGKTEFDGLIYATASACADGFKVILPFTAAWSWRNSRFLAAFASICLFLIFSAYSLTSSLGFSATNRAETTGFKNKQVNDYRAIQNTYKRTLREREALPPFRPVYTLQGLMRAKEQNTRWSATERCTNATVGLSRVFCNDYYNLKSELGTAQHAQKLDKKLEVLQTRLQNFESNVAVNGNVDPQVQILKDISGLAKNKVEMSLIIILSLLVEFGSGLGLFVTFGHGQIPSRRKPPSKRDRLFSQIDKITTPQPLLLEHSVAKYDDWALTCLLRDPSAQTSLNDLYHSYSKWCDMQQNLEKMTLTAFGRWLSEIGLCETQRIQGRVYYNGIRVKDHYSKNMPSS